MPTACGADTAGKPDPSLTAIRLACGGRYVRGVFTVIGSFLQANGWAGASPLVVSVLHA